jgi:membrane protease YdiL (CAAX protease family)
MTPEPAAIAEDHPPRSYRRLAEAIVLFGVAPLVLAVFMRGWMVFPAIWLLGVICLAVLLADGTFPRRRLWNAGAARSELGRAAFCFCIGAPVLALALLLTNPGGLFALPREHTRLWLVIMAAYPILSVYAQELAFRAFFFHRYASVFRSEWAMIAASAAAFGFAHVILHNWISVAFAAVGGLLFGFTFARSKSLLACCLEHAAYGCFIFTVGWGPYFYGGSLGR